MFTRLTSGPVGDEELITSQKITTIRNFADGTHMCLPTVAAQGTWLSLMCSTSHCLVNIAG